MPAISSASPKVYRRLDCPSRARFAITERHSDAVKTRRLKATLRACSIARKSSRAGHAPFLRLGRRRLSRAAHHRHPGQGGGPMRIGYGIAAAMLAGACATAAQAQDMKVSIGIAGWTGFAPIILARDAG